MITRANLDYFAVAVRAAHRHPENGILWSESVRAHRAVITAADNALPEREAARVQGKLGILADYASNEERALAAERVKGDILAIVEFFAA